MRHRAEDLMDRAVAEMWGWSPGDTKLTPQQQAGAVLTELRSQLRDYGITTSRLAATVAGESGELIIDIQIGSFALSKRYAAAATHNMQGSSEHADPDAFDHLEKLGGEGGGA